MSRYKTSRTPEVHSARSKLDGVLQTLVHKVEDSPTKEEESDEPEAPFSGAVTTPTKRSYPHGKKSRKKRKGASDAGDELGQYHHTYVMKLFDRSVDLAQFGEATPLYPICRAWMRNQPHNRNLGASSAVGDPRSHSPSPQHGCSGVDDDDPRSVHALPGPTAIKIEGVKRDNLRIPSPIPSTDHPLDIYADASLVPPPEQLLLGHMTRWKRTRQAWKEAARLNEVRYAKSFTILRNMFENSTNG